MWCQLTDDHYLNLDHVLSVEFRRGPRGDLTADVERITLDDHIQVAEEYRGPAAEALRAALMRRTGLAPEREYLLLDPADGTTVRAQSRTAPPPWKPEHWSPASPAYGEGF